MKKRIVLLLILGWYLLVWVACKPDKDPEPDNSFPGFVKPENFPAPTYHFETNPITEKGFQLGKKLFYDPILSVDNTISCASCHIPTNAFAQQGHDLSHGVESRLGTRNSPALMHLAWMPLFFHDGGVADLDLQPINPITSEVEMDMDIALLPEKLAAAPDYKEMFEAAFGVGGLNGTNMLKALSQFMLMCVSSNSKYDSVQTGKAVFSSLENEGYVVFKSKCASCHQEPFFTDFSFRNNGLPIGASNDSGRAKITLTNEDLYKFKVPSLRNLQYTAPYMHDGRMSTLSEVLAHYTSHIPDLYGTLDPILKKPSGTSAIVLTPAEQTALLAFLETLNDKKFITNPLLAP